MLVPILVLVKYTMLVPILVLVKYTMLVPILVLVKYTMLVPILAKKGVFFQREARNREKGIIFQA